MRADTLELRRVLSLERRYVIPTFQRDYEWTREGQWELLHEDLVDAANRLQSARAKADASGESRARADKRVTPHFLGAIVCDQLPSSTGGIDQRAVIDGQQRLTTLQLMARGVLDVLLEVGSPRAAQIRRLILNPADVVVQPVDQYKLWPRRKDREVWPSVIADDPVAPTGHLYLEARTYFADQTRAVLKESGEPELLDAIVDAFLDLFKLVVIDLDDNDEAQVIFEVLNGRQTPLSATDLVKNLLFLRGDISGESELDELYEKYWAQFDDPWWKATVGTGHAARGRRDVLLSAWLTAVSGEDVNVGHLYSLVRSYLSGQNDETNSNEKDTKAILKELSQYASAYKIVYNPDRAESPLLSHAYSRLNRLRVLSVVPLLLWLRSLPEGALSLSEHETAVTAIESWVMRRMITGANTRAYSTFFVEVLKAARQAQELESNIVVAIVTSLESSSLGLAWPQDDEVYSAFLNNRFYGPYPQERIRLILGAIDKQLHSENLRAEPAEFDYERLQIEHVLPQSWQTHWTITASDPAQLELAIQQRNTAVQRIGNLTLVTRQFNRGVSNYGWDAKRPEFSSQSTLQINKSIAGAEAWDETAIEQRAQQLAEVACRVWPRFTQS